MHILMAIIIMLSHKSIEILRYVLRNSKTWRVPFECNRAFIVPHGAMLQDLSCARRKRMLVCAAGLKKTDLLEAKVRALLAERRQRMGCEPELVAVATLSR